MPSSKNVEHTRDRAAEAGDSAVAAAAVLSSRGRCDGPGRVRAAVRRAGGEALRGAGPVLETARLRGATEAGGGGVRV